VVEHLHDINRCRTIFATHYHELTTVTTKMPGIRNATVTVREHDGDVIFLHEVIMGAADRSYGVQVARLAGLPSAVVDRARVVLDKLEASERSGGKTAMIDDLPLFNIPAPQAAPESGVETLLRDIHPDALSPREALALIYDLRAKLKD